MSSNIIQRQRRTYPSQCRICGASAQYSYYGAIVCHSCKTKKTCDFGNICEINLNNRHICSPCRLAKCLAIGMKKELIRGPQLSCHEKRQKKYSTSDTTVAALVTFTNKYRQKQIPTLNLLQSDQSILSIEQWNLLSNLIHSFDQYSGYSYNRDFLSLSTNDRTILLRITAEYTSSIGGIFLLYQSHLFDYSLFYQSTQTIFSSNSTATIKRVIGHLDSDDTFIKLVLAILAFSTTNYTIYSGSMSHLIDSNAILPTQNLYTEITWRYLLHKYNQNEAVIRFMNVIRCMLLVNKVIVEAHDSQQFMEIVDDIIEQSEQKLHIY
ncbi:hypothetical protein I4U23_026884 [Adineta vaga]|nr:hypothetical protein I4U23_026884 [Adineta vaga]